MKSCWLVSGLSAVALASPAIADTPSEDGAEPAPPLPEWQEPLPSPPVPIPGELSTPLPDTLAPEWSAQWSSPVYTAADLLPAVDRTPEALSLEAVDPNVRIDLSEDLSEHMGGQQTTEFVTEVASEFILHSPAPGDAPTGPDPSLTTDALLSPSLLPPPPTPDPLENPEFSSPSPDAHLWEAGLFEHSLDQVTSVTQLSDVQPSDWSYQALQSLVERYGVIAGYPDGTFQGDRALTRYEFAAAFNAAMDVLDQQLREGLSDRVTQEDLELVQRLQQEFSTELIALEGQVDALDRRTAELEAHQFSTTVRLNGEGIFGLATAGGGDPPGTGDANPILTYRSELQLSGSFTGRDAFRVGLSAGNFGDGGFANPFVLNTNMALMSYQLDTDNAFQLSSLEYRFAVGDRLVVTVKPYGFDLSTVLNVNSIYSSAGYGALSRFASHNPLFRIGGLDAGVGVDFLLSDRTRLQVAYGARHASQPAQGLFSSDHRALGVQLLARPFDQVTTGIAYINAFASDGHLDTFTGSNNADTSGGFEESAAIHGLAGTLQWRITPGVILGAWGGVTVTDSLPSNAGALSTTYLFSLGFPDPFGREGDLLGVMVGQPLRLRAGINIEREDEGAGMHYEAFYRFRVNDHIAITPGFFVVTNPGHIAENDTIFVGAIRTTISF